jgi:formate hydrogenlyase subunit 3/multisubunit Na+/H+ antiporter MnhD subunit
MLLLIPLIILLVGAGALVFTLTPRFPYAALLAIGTAALAFLTLAGLALSLPAAVVLSDWGALASPAARLAFRADALAWVMATGIAALTLAALLTGLARPGGPRILGRGAMLLLALAGIAAVLADNLTTRVMAWAGLDLIYFMALVLLARNAGMQWQAILNLSFNAIATLLGTAALLLLARDNPAPTLREAAVSPATTLLITLAMVFRLGLFPLHLGLPTEGNTRRGVGTLLRLIPAVVALEVLARLSQYGIAEPLRLWLTLFGTLAALVGGSQLWEITDVSQGLTYTVIAQTGVALLAALWGGAHADLAVTAVALALLLGGGLLYLSNGYDEGRPWLSAISALGAACLLGAPLTIGFVGYVLLYGGLFAAGGWLWAVLAALVVAHANLTVRQIRAVLWPGDPVASDAATLSAYLGGLGLLGAGSVLAAVLIGPLSAGLGQPVPGVLSLADMSGLTALGLLALAAAAGWVMWRFDVSLRSRTEAWAALFASITQMRWLYGFLGGLIRGLSALIANVAQVLEGEGALLWALAAAVAVALLFQP